MSLALSKCIVQPCRLASTVDWKRGALLALDIQKDRIALAIANPSNGTQVHRLQSIPYNTSNNNNNNNNTPCSKIINVNANKSNDNNDKNTHSVSQEWREAQKQAVYHEILDIVQEEDISGFVCAWPLETSGQPGKSCGQIFHLLDYFIEQKEGLLTRSRPLTLWDERQWTHQTYEETTMPQDVWGRSSLFSRAPPSRVLNMSIPTIRYPPSSSSSSTSTTSYSSHCIHEEEDGEYDSSSSSSNSTTNRVVGPVNTACIDSDDMACLVLENFVSLYFDTEKDKNRDIDHHHHHHQGIDSKRLNQGLIESLVHYDQFGGSGSSHFSLAPL